MVEVQPEHIVENEQRCSDLLEIKYLGEPVRWVIISLTKRTQNENTQ